MQNTHVEESQIIRQYKTGMGQAVADRTINRDVVKTFPSPIIKKIKLAFLGNISINEEVSNYCQSNNIKDYIFKVEEHDNDFLNIELTIYSMIKKETWEDVAARVALGNTLLNPVDKDQEYKKMHHHLLQASILMSGRHLQHGDKDQPLRNMEVFTNCATSASSFLMFYLLLNGSGVGRSMDDDMILVDFKNLPIIVPVISFNHPDVLTGEISERLNIEMANHMYKSKTVVVFEVPDSREGWAHAIEKMEYMAFKRIHRNDVLILDFSNVRARGAGIGGMQNRPASGPGPLILAIDKISKLRDASMEPWRAAMFADHYLAECVLVGGARRAARMATKNWRDRSIFDFISLKRGGFLWSSNNSVTVDQEFWKYVKDESILTDVAIHARSVFTAISQASYLDGTGEPGIINQDLLVDNKAGIEEWQDGEFARSKKYIINEETIELTRQLAHAAYNKQYLQITNPCGEISLNLLGGYCVIADVVPYHALSDEDAVDAFKTATRALIRVNLMDSMYKKEVLRTNRIGVGITGFHEWAYSRFGFGFKDIINEEKSKEMWMLLARFKRAVKEEARAYSLSLGLNVPHTDTTIKPAGTTSKLFGLTEGAHLPSMREYLRWVQFRNDDPLIDNYQEKGYPIKELKSYSGTTVVGFPTQPEICRLGMGDRLVTAAEATAQEQYEYLRLFEKYWIHGVDELGRQLSDNTGNQISYTLKYYPNKLSLEDFTKTLIDGQSQIRCCSVMPQTDTSAYEYQPEERMTTSRYHQIMSEIMSNETPVKEEVSFEHIDCKSGACPIDFKEN